MTLLRLETRLGLTICLNRATSIHKGINEVLCREQVLLCSWWNTFLLREEMFSQKRLELCRFDGWSLIFIMPFHTVLVCSSSGVRSVYFRVICALGNYFCLCQNPLAMSQQASPQMTHCSWLSFLLYTLHFLIPASKQKIFTMRRYSRPCKLLKRTAKQQPCQLGWPTWAVKAAVCSQSSAPTGLTSPPKSRLPKFKSFRTLPLAKPCKSQTARGLCKSRGPF